MIDSVKHYVAESDCIHYLVVNLEALKYSRNPFSNKVKHLCALGFIVGLFCKLGKFCVY